MSRASYLRRNYVLPKHVYDQLREVSNATGIPVSKVIDAAFSWWLDRVEKERGYLPRFLAKVKAYKREFEASEKKPTPAYLTVPHATLLDVFSRNLNIEKPLLLYAVFEEYRKTLGQ